MGSNNSTPQNNLTTLAKRLRPFLLAAVASSTQTVAQAWGGIMYIPINGGTVEYFPVTQQGLTDAVAAALAGGVAYMIWIPTATLGGDHTVPASGGLVSMGNRTILTGKITGGGNNSYLRGMTVSRTASDGNDLIGVQAPTSGTMVLNECTILTTQSGAGNSYAVQGAAGNIDAWNSDLDGQASGGGNGHAVKAGAGIVTLYHCVTNGSTSDFG